MKLSKIEQAIQSIDEDIQVLEMAKARLIGAQGAKPARVRKPKAVPADKA